MKDRIMYKALTTTRGGTPKSTMFNIGDRRPAFTRKNAKLKRRRPQAGGRSKLCAMRIARAGGGLTQSFFSGARGFENSNGNQRNQKSSPLNGTATFRRSDRAIYFLYEGASISAASVGLESLCPNCGKVESL
jgi:hypothetical protein